jgi:hypothetical protein
MLIAMRDGKSRLKSAILTGGDIAAAPCHEAVLSNFSGVLTAFLPDWQDSSNYGSAKQTYAKIEHGLGLHSPQTGAVCKDID